MALVNQQQSLSPFVNPGKARIDNGQKGTVAFGHDIWVICPCFIHTADEVKI